jgi:hypothetical protein
MSSVICRVSEELLRDLLASWKSEHVHTVEFRSLSADKRVVRFETEWCAHPTPTQPLPDCRVKVEFTLFYSDAHLIDKAEFTAKTARPVITYRCAHEDLCFSVRGYEAPGDTASSCETSSSSAASTTPSILGDARAGHIDHHIRRLLTLKRGCHANCRSRLLALKKKNTFCNFVANHDDTQSIYQFPISPLSLHSYTNLSSAPFCNLSLFGSLPLPHFCLSRSLPHTNNNMKRNKQTLLSWRRLTGSFLASGAAARSASVQPL